jgi:adenylate cyclase
METDSFFGKINISENTFAIIKESFDCGCRGEAEVKNRGMLKNVFCKRYKRRGRV